jgi:phage gp46-like protein
MDIRYLQQTDIAITGTAVELDWLLTPAHLLADGFALQTAVIIALGTDARAGANDVLPDPDSTDRGGWWGDMDAEEIWNGWPVGCRLWLLRRAKITGPLSKEGDTVSRADSYTRECMRPFTDNLIASQIDVTASRTDRGRIDVGVVIIRDHDNIALRYASLWDELGTN